MQHYVEALVKQEGSQHVVRLYDKYGLELPCWLFAARYEGSSYGASFDSARDRAWAVAGFINGLPMSVRNAIYESATKGDANA